MVLLRKEFRDNLVDDFVLIMTFFFFFVRIVCMLACHVFTLIRLVFHLKQTQVLVHKLVKDLDELSCRWSFVKVNGEALVEQSLNDGVSLLSFVVCVLVFVVSVNSPCLDALFDFFWALTVEGVSLGVEVVEAAT